MTWTTVKCRLLQLAHAPGGEEDERDRCLVGLSPKDAERARITRFKGLGEMNLQQLKESTMVVGKRRRSGRNTSSTQRS